MKKSILIFILCFNLLPAYHDSGIHIDGGQTIYAQPIPCPPPPTGGSSGGFWKSVGDFFVGIGNAIGGFFQSIWDWFNQSPQTDPTTGETYGSEGLLTWDPPYAPDPFYDAGGGFFDPSSDPFFTQYNDFFSQYYDASGIQLNPFVTPPTCATSVVFKESASQSYGFDDYTDNLIPWKSVESNKMDPVKVEITPAALYSNVFFKSLNMTTAQVGFYNAQSSPYELNLFAEYLTSPLLVEVQANCESVDGTNLAKINVAVYPIVQRYVLVTCVNSAASGNYLGYTSTDVTDATIENYLRNQSYNQGVVNWTVVRQVTGPIDFDENQDGRLETGTYLTSEQLKIKQLLGNAAYDANLFLVNNPSLTTSNGQTAPSVKISFVYPDITPDITQTIAHELGHAAFNLPDIYSGGDTNNFMWYSGTFGVKFRKGQWDIMHQ
ncbi:MAG: hypothetical protein Q8L07_13165 [Sediminibacterium sp.]|nr:hypothetical protein [Sediminibacterium sp.]